MSRVSRRSALVLALLAGLSITAAASADADGLTASYDDLLAHHIMLTLGEERIVPLPLGGLLPGSERLLLEGTPMEPGRDYRLDPIQGRLELTRAAPGSRLELHAERRPWGLPRMMNQAPFRSWQEMKRHLDAEPVAANVAAPRHEIGAPPAVSRSSFRMGGSKSLVMRLGSGEELALEQSLRLQLQGQISDSTSIEAVLRDDDLPFQPEGNTERLEELDKVFLRVKGPAGMAQVGDFVFAAPDRELTPFRRDFQGIQGEWRGSGGSAGLWLARSRGLFESVEFYGVDGLQGPYELLSALREGGAVILAGSEQVRLNGRLLTRGRDRDYVIDYDLGSITFGGRRLIGASDIIRVDFRYSQENWRRGAWGASGAGRLGPLRLSLLHFSEKDDPTDPLAMSLDDERRAALEAAGDRADLAVTDGITERPGQGRYVMTHEDPDQPDLATYAWVDSLGDFNLRFREVGPGRGDYSADGVSLDGERIFAYAGQGLGGFLLGEALTPPESYRLESLRLDWRGERRRASGELALSDLDANLLASLDDDDNAGLALRAGLEGALAEPAGEPLALKLGVERREERFHFPGASRGVADYRRWNLPWLPERTSEDRLLASLGWGEERFRKVAGKMEGLRLGERFDGLRGELSAGGRWKDVGLRGELSAAASRDSVLGEGSREQATVELQTPLPVWRGVVLTGERAAQEHPDSLDSQRTLEQRGNHESGAVEFRFGSRGGPGSWNLSWREERFRAEDSPRDRQRHLSADLNRGLPAAGRLDLSSRYRKRWGGSESEQFQAEARLAWLARPGAWGGEGRYRLGSRRQRLRESQLVFVGLGQGDLNEDGIHVGEGEGDYRRVSVPGEESVRTQGLELEARVQRLERRQGGFWQRLGSETRMVLKEENRDDDPWALAGLDLSRFQRPGSTLLGSLELSQELRMRPAMGGLDFRYRYRYLDRLDARDSAGRRDEAEQDHRLRGRLAGEQSSLELTLIHTALLRSGSEGSGGGNYEVREWGAELEGNRHLSDRSSLRLRGEGRRRRDALRELALRELGLAPGLAITPAGSFRIEASWEFSHSAYDEGDPELGRPWFFDAPGWQRTLRLGATAQAGSNLTLSVRYELREEADEPRRQRLRMESRAFF